MTRWHSGGSAGSSVGRGGIDPAVRQARAVVGLYGDPTVTWSILLEVRPAAPVDPGEAAGRLRELAARYPRLGRPAELTRISEETLGETRQRFADTPYGDHDSLVRVAVTEPGGTVLVAAHHGAVDGLGLVAVANAVLDTGLIAQARGLAGTPADGSFATRAVRRVGEAVVRPPVRFRASGGSPNQSGDHLAAVDVTARHLSTAGLLLATREALGRWNGGVDEQRVVVAVGASRRPARDPLRPDRATAYLRVPVGRVRDLGETAALLAGAVPEPDFPATRGLGAGELVTRALSSRLGATALVSNLGRLSGHGVRHATLWPTASGPAGIAIGLVTVGGSSSLSVRVRRDAFDADAATRLLRLVGSALERVGAGPQ